MDQDQISIRIIKERSKPSVIHFIIYFILTIVSTIIIGRLVLGAIASIVSFITLFLIAVFIDQKLTAKRLGISSKLMFTCIGLDTSLELLADRSLRAYIEIKQNLKHLPRKDSITFVRFVDKCCVDYLLLLNLVSKRDLEMQYYNLLSEIVILFEHISLDIKNPDKLKNCVDIAVELANKINTITNKVFYKE